MILSLRFLPRFGVRTISLLLLLLGASLLTQAQSQTIHYVKPTATGTGSGNSWANASGDLQAMIAASNSGQQVWVAQGTYKPGPAGNTDRTSSFSMKDGVAIHGGFVGTETSLSQRPAINPVSGNPSSTTLSGDIGTVGTNSDNSYHIIYNLTGLTTTAVLDGFVLAGGRADGSNFTQNAGGGIYNDGFGTGKSCSPLILNCLFQNNSATEFGGALFNDGSFAGRSHPVLTNCLFQTNSASAGGAIFNKGESSDANPESGSSPVLTNCSFLTNSASAGGAIANDAQGSGRSNPTLTNCFFRGNTAANVGGAIYNNGIYSGLSSPTLTNCSFQSNTAKRGGAIYNDAYGDGTSSPTLTNCSFQNNSASEYGGAIYSKAIVGNAVSKPTLTNCVVFGNGGGNTFSRESNSPVVATYSLFDDSVGDYSGSNNLTTSASPFVSATDTRLNGCSPAINAGNNAANSTATDLAGNARRYNGSTIDMGAYEYQAAPTLITITAPGVSTATMGVAFSQPFTASGGSSPYSYSLASGSLPTGLNLATTGVLSGTPTQSGSFTSTVLGQDANGCSAVSAPYVLTVTDAVSPSPTLTGLTPSPGTVCAGTGVTFTATVGNVTGSYGYTLTNGLGSSLSGTASSSSFSQSVTASGTGPQTFTLTVSASGQSASSVTTLTVSPLPVASLTNNGPLSCAQTSVTLTASGGSSYTFTSGTGVLGTPGAANTVAVSSPGTYSVTVANASGCVSSTSTTVSADQSVPTVSITPGSATLSCASPTVSLTAVGTGSVRWNTGETTPVILASVANTYSVTLTSANGCSAVASASVSQDNTAPVASLVSSGSLTCSVTSVTLTASPDGQRYQFSSGATQIGTSNQAVVNASGPYSVTVVSGNGCSSVASVSVSQDNTVPAVSLVNSGTLSCGVTLVTLTASPGGVRYIFSDGATPLSTGNQAVVSQAGLYSVTVLAGNGCLATASTTVESNTAAVTVINPSVNTATTGVAFSQPFTASGGTSPYSYSLASGNLPSGLNLATTGTLSGTPTQVGNFTITVKATDASSCSALSAAYTLTVSQPATPIRYVRVGASGSGDSWADASGDLQSQINLIGAQQVWVAQGTYKPGGNANTDRALSFSMKDGVTILGGFPASGNPALAERNPSSLTTILSGDIGTVGTNSDNSYHVVNNQNLDNTAVLDGFVVRDGHAFGGGAQDNGGGMLNTLSSPTLRGIRFLTNAANNGGAGMYDDSQSQPTLTNCRFVSNTAGGGGGGIYNIASNPTLTNCAFVGNSAGFGGGMYSNSSSANLINCLFQNNVAVDQAGGALYNATGSNPTLTNCSLQGNVANLGGGNGLYNGNGSNATLINCALFGNGGAQTFGLDNGEGPTNSVTVRYSLLETGTANYVDENNNLTVSVSPFVSTTDARLNACSPAINAGDNAANSSSTDLAGNPRRYNGGQIDMGAYEYQGDGGIRLTSPGVNTATVNVAFSQRFTASGGSAPYTYRLAGGSLPAGLSLAADGTLSGTPTQSGSFSLTVSVTDASSCSAVSAVYTLTVTDAAPMLAGFAATASPVCVGSVTTFTATVGNVTGSYGYTLTNGLGTSLSGTASSTSFSQSVTASGTGAQTFTLTVSASGQSASSVASLTVSPLPVASLTNNGPLSCAQTSVTLTASGGTSYTFVSGTGVVGTPGAANTVAVSSPGTYSVTVANASGCVSSTSTTVTTDQTVPTVSITPSSATLSCASPSVRLTAVGTGSVHWSTGETTPVISVSVANTYSVTLTSANGCSAVASASVSQDNTAPVASLVSSGSLTCSVTSVTLTASPDGQRYQFSSGAMQIGTSNQATVNASGTYSVTVLSANGCSSVASTTVMGDQAAPAVSISANPSLTITQGQSATLTALVTGSSPVTYRWNTGLTTSAIVASAAGPYSVTVTAANGCLATASVVLSVSEPVVAAPFAITAVTTIACTAVLPNRYSISFTPRYSGLNGQPISFSVVNELLPTTEPGPYTIQLYTDNPTINLNARQGGTPNEATYTYDWLAACLASTSPNTPPRLVSPIPPQSTTVGVGYSYVIPTGTFTDEQTPTSLVLSAQGLPPGIRLSGYTFSGVASTTVGSPFNVTLTATDPGGLSVSTSFAFTVLPAPVGPIQPTVPFAITAVSLLTCTPIADRININFTPRYAGLNGQAIAFSVVNELAATNEPGPYSLTLYRDNPVINLRATQTGSAETGTFAYNWLAACVNQGQDNTPPVVVSPIGSQTGLVGQSFELNIGSTFIDQETPTSLRYSVGGLPAGLSLSGTRIAGVPQTAGVSSVTLTATDGGGLSTSTGFTLTISQPTSPTQPVGGMFDLTGVQTLSCVVVSGGQRAVTFMPQYAGLDGSPVSFSVVNELSATTAAGPYTLNLYTDNPAITLSARQGSRVSSYRYNWLAGCPSGARTATTETASGLQVTVLGNPIVDQQLEVIISGVDGQRVDMTLVDLQGVTLQTHRLEQAAAVDRVRLAVGTLPGVFMLHVSTATERRVIKLLKP